MLILIRGDGDLDFLPVWPECVGLLCDRSLNIYCASDYRIEPTDTTKDHALILLGRRTVHPPWIFQTDMGLSRLHQHTFTIDRIANSWILRVNTTPATQYFLPDYQPDIGLLHEIPSVATILGRENRSTFWDRL